MKGTTMNPNAVFVDVRGHQVNADPDSRDAVGNNECTRDPIFLLQLRSVEGIDPDVFNAEDFDYESNLVRCDDAYGYFDDGDISKAKKDGTYTDEDLPSGWKGAIGVSEDYMIEQGWLKLSWRVESIWFRREEAEAYARAKEYRFGKLGIGCRVYCVCAEGRLADLLKVVDCKEVEGYLHSQDFKNGFLAYMKMQNTMIGGK